jgi:hypothetical protein
VDAVLVARDNRFESPVALVGFQMDAVLERNTFAAPSNLRLTRIRKLSGLAFAGPDRNTFEGEGPYRAVFLDRIEVPAGQSWTLGPEGGAVFVRGLPPYGFEGVTVEGDLRLLPGTVVKTLPGNGNDFVVRATGRIEALGDPSDPVTFTAYADDSIGGDTNGDGPTVPPLSPNQTTIHLRGSAEISNAYFLFGGTAVDAADAELAVTDTTFDGKVLVERYDGSTETLLERNTFEGRFGRPLYLEDLEDVSGVALAGLDANFFPGNDAARGVEVHRVHIPADSSWRIGAESRAVLIPHSSYDIDAGVYVAGALRIDPGVIVKNRANGPILALPGSSVEISGSDAEPVAFTAFTDDTLGGDTNDDGADSSPSVGSGGIAVKAASTALVIDRALFRYSSKAIVSDRAEVRVWDSQFEATRMAVDATQTWFPSICPERAFVSPGYGVDVNALPPVALLGSSTFDGHPTPAVSSIEMAKIVQRLANLEPMWLPGWVTRIRVDDTNQISWDVKSCRVDVWTESPVVATPVGF